MHSSHYSNHAFISLDQRFFEGLFGLRYSLREYLQQSRTAGADEEPLSVMRYAFRDLFRRQAPLTCRGDSEPPARGFPSPTETLQNCGQENIDLISHAPSKARSMPMIDNSTKVVLDGFETKHVTGKFPVS